MKSKQLLFVIGVIAASFIFVTPILATYSSVTGVVLDSETHNPWMYGGTITAYDCADLGGFALNSDSISTADGTFDMMLPDAKPDSGYLCVKIEFQAGPDGTPNDKYFFTVSGTTESEAYDLGNVYTDTGPNAVRLNSYKGSAVMSLPMFALVALTGLFTGAKALVHRKAK